MTRLDCWWRRSRLLAGQLAPDARFPEPQEREWLRKFTADQAGIDAAVSLQTLLFPSLVARLLWDQARSANAGDGLFAVDGLWLAGFLAWAPLLLWLSMHRPKAYLRLRTPIVMLCRLHRSLTFVRWAGLYSREAMGSGGAAGAMSRQAQLGLLLWRPTSLVSLLLSYLVPFRFTAPCAVVMLGMALHSAAQQCAAFCRGSPEERAAVQLAPELVELLRGWQRFPRGTTAGCTVHSAAAGVCSIADSPVPPAPAACDWAGCRNNCIAVNAWALIVLGTLLPLAVLWAVEERSRLRFQQELLRLQQAARGVSPVASGNSSGQMHGLSWPALCAWLLFFAWAAWVALDLLILR